MDEWLSQRDKFLENVRNNPGGIQWRELEPFLRAMGFQIRKRKHFVVFHPLLETQLPIPFDRPLKATYVRRLLNMIKDLEGHE